MMELQRVIGLSVRGITYSYNKNKISVGFETDETYTYLNFFECSLAFDSGIVGKVVQKAEEYGGEMGFVLALREMNLSADDYKYFMLKGEGGKEHNQNLLRIAFKFFEIEVIKKS